MIGLALWRARIGLFIPQSTCPGRQLLVHHVEKLLLNEEILHLLLMLVISVAFKPKMLAGDLDMSAGGRKKQSKYINEAFPVKLSQYLIRW